jgi:ribosomal RNA-processing protein 12
VKKNCCDFSNLFSEENKAELAKFAKNFLPIFFNLFTTDNGRGERDGARLAVFETIKCYFQVGVYSISEIIVFSL